MNVNLQQLLITPEDLKVWLDLDAKTTLTLDFYRGFVKGEIKSLTSVLITEFFAFILVLVMIMPLGLMVLKSTGQISNNPEFINRFLFLVLALASFVTLGLNVYFWQQMKRVKILAKFLEEIAKFNRMIGAIQLLDRFDNVQGVRGSSLTNYEEILTLLQTTRDSLIKGLEIEQLARSHHHLIASRYQLLAQLEQNFETLMAFESDRTVQDYSQLLKEALEIGLVVHQEVRKLGND